ncbi:hypothetical protein [Streptomyces sp. MS2.AVA.5]|uniref:Uncharacterized protein n=1 Tax=Streptomyces achmelvichensis TaxID=3134111 RepID=A0ACC6PMK2_9ACTN
MATPTIRNVLTTGRQHFPLTPATTWAPRTPTAHPEGVAIEIVTGQVGTGMIPIAQSLNFTSIANAACDLSNFASSSPWSTGLASLANPQVHSAAHGSRTWQEPRWLEECGASSQRCQLCSWPC